MDSPATVQGALRRFLNNAPVDAQRRKVCGHLLACRTEAMGGRVMRCEHCEGEQRWYHGCRDRHCPQCQGRATRLWAQRQREAVLPVAYYHVVFTLPHTLNGWVQLHPQVIYGLLFRCAWSTLEAFGRDPKRLGGQVGMDAVLHTWGQNLSERWPIKEYLTMSEDEWIPISHENCEQVDGPFYHGTKADLVVGDLLVSGHPSNFEEGRVSNHLYFATRLEAAIWGAELAMALSGLDGRGYIYIVEPTGPFEDDPNLTNKKYPGNLTRSYRTREPLKIIGVVEDWDGHSAEVLQGMLDSLESLKRRGLAVIED